MEQTLLATELLTGKIYAKTRERKEKLDFAIAGVHALLNVCQRVYVSLSFGKQSSCLAHMVFKIKPQIPMYFLASDETWHMYNYQEVIDKFCKKWPIDLHIVQTHHFFNTKTWKEGRDEGDQDIQKMCAREDFDGWFWGLAKEESFARKLTCSKNNTKIHPTIFRYTDNKLRGTPLQDWGIDDLAAYIYEYDIPLLNIYEKYGLKQRTTARITKKCRDFGANTLWRTTNSQGFRTLVDKHREIEQ